MKLRNTTQCEQCGKEVSAVLLSPGSLASLLWPYQVSQPCPRGIFHPSSLVNPRETFLYEWIPCFHPESCWNGRHPIQTSL